MREKTDQKYFFCKASVLRFYQLRLVCTQNTLQIFSSTTWFSKNACSPKLLPKPAIFLHRYFPDILDILQPWLVALVTVDVKSAFVADSAASPQLSCYEEETEGGSGDWAVRIRGAPSSNPPKTSQDLQRFPKTSQDKRNRKTTFADPKNTR